MIPYDYKLAFRIFNLLRKEKGISKFSSLECIILYVFILFFYLINNMFFLVDELVFFSYRKISVKTPMFIIGPPRSGTSFFHRLLAENKQFTSMKMWEIMFAPAISQKYLFLFFGKMDGLLGSPLYKIIKNLDSKVFSRMSKYHKTGIFEYEEDAYIFRHIGTTPFMSLNWPFMSVQNLFLNFDEVASKEYKEMNMHFYEKCIKKHLFVFGNDKTYVSKNPLFSSYVKTLCEKFESANFIYIYRTPYEVVPSALSLVTYLFSFWSLLDPPAIKKIMLEALRIYYRHPLEVLNHADKRKIMVSYTELVKSPKSTIEGVFSALGLSTSSEYEHYLEEQDQRSKGFVSKNSYTYEQYGLSKSEIGEIFEDIFSQELDKVQASK